jgi:hypothetical protein
VIQLFVFFFLQLVYWYSDFKIPCSYVSRQTSLFAKHTCLTDVLVLGSISLLSIYVWPCSLFWALASLKRCLHSSVSPTHLLQPRICSICNASLWLTSFHLVHDFPIVKFPIKSLFCDSSSTFMM